MENNKAPNGSVLVWTEILSKKFLFHFLKILCVKDITLCAKYCAYEKYHIIYLDYKKKTYIVCEI